MKVFKTVSSLAAAVLLMAGCAFNAVQPGMSREEVIAHSGAPTRTVPLSSGTRLQYSGQPAGQWAVMVDLDTAGKVVSVRQVLNPREFARVEPGKWTREDMEREFGRPAIIDHVASWPGDIMTYRWLENYSQGMFFWAYLDDHNVVQRTGQGMEFPVESPMRLMRKVR
ncbi:hypothetical protein [Polaromonas jejuensis]|uniref:Lipoprotein transmembrane n=1 Tax=Polaromonas jejuensis TaxID=457502 RepID=A0ABW0QD20_9BURK|nr:hypothetical protein [Polaromonas jejuensis]